MIFPDIVEYLRAVLDDYGDVDEITGEILPETRQYTDDKLSVLLVVSIRYLQTRMRFPKEARLDTMLEWPYVNPFHDIKDDFVELIILRALCALQKREIEGQFGSSHVSAALGPAKIQVGKAQWAGMPAHIWEQTSPCAELEKKLLEWAAFDTRKLYAVYAILPGQASNSGATANNRWQASNTSPGTDMIQ